MTEQAGPFPTPAAMPARSGTPAAGPSPVGPVPARPAEPSPAEPSPAEPSPAEPPSDPVATLRTAMAAADSLRPPPATASGSTGTADAADPDFEPTKHAERFEAVHDALVAVLADIDRS